MTAKTSRNAAPELSAAEQAELVETAEAMATAARAAILPLFRSAGLSADNKSSNDFDPVTEADRAAERAMRGILAERRPDDGILGEEYGHTEGSTGLTWVLDPIDGTRAFVAGTPTWGVLIAIRRDRRVIHGVMDQPFTNERWSGGLCAAQHRSPLGDRALLVRAGRPLDQAILMTTFPEVGTPEDGAAFRRVAEQVRLVRYGLDCYAYGLLALGQIDLVIEAGLQAYDICGPLGVIEAAGGIVSSWEGGSAVDGGRVIAAANAEVHSAAMALLRGT